MKRKLLVATCCFFTPVFAAVDVSQVPLDSVNDVPPNILLIVDNSNSMLEDEDGLVAADCEPWLGEECLVGSSSPLSKSEIIRGVARNLVSDYTGQVNLGLMAYQQNPPSNTTNDWNNRVIRAWVVNRLYAVSYNPENYDGSEDCSFDLSDWDTAQRCSRFSNPSDPNGYIHYNIGVPGFSSANAAPRLVTHAYTQNYASGYKDSPFSFNSFASKVGTQDGSGDYNLSRCRWFRSQGTWLSNCNNMPPGYSLHMGPSSGVLNDSARARGVTHWGRRMAALSFNTQEWTSITSPGLGYLHTPIRLLDETQAHALNLKLAPVPTNYRQNITTDASQPLINAGLTPLEGTLYTAHDYFRGRQQHFGAQQGRGNAETRLPESCEVNAAIWLTDGMPSVDRQGNALGNNPDRALNDAVAAAERLHRDAGVDLYVVGFAMPPTVDPDALKRLAQAGGTPDAFMAENTDDLNEAIRGIFGRVIQEGRQTATSAAVNSGRLTDDTLAFLSGYRPGDASGELFAQNLKTGDPVWSAEQRLLNSSAPVLIFNEEQGELLDLRNDALPSKLLDSLNRNPSSNREDHLAEARIKWLTGTESSHLRSRTEDNQKRLLGSIVHTTPIHSGGVTYRGQDALPGMEGQRFWSYARQVENQTPLVIAGANDGKIHAFRADDGRHQFSFIPSEFVAAEQDQAAPINSLMDPDYTERFWVNGGLSLGDAYVENEWQRILLATLGQGGQSVVALNVNRLQQAGSKSKARLWEFEHPNLGVGVKDAQIVRLANGTWAAVFGSGVNTEDHKAGLFVVDLATGKLLRFLQTDRGSKQNPNGILAAAPSSQSEGGLLVDRVYAGDLQGHVWRFDLTASDPDEWSADRLFTARSSDNKVQPITSAPRVTRDQRLPDQRIVLVGTGSFFRTGDRADQTVQSFYGLHDNGQSISGRSQLLAQTIDWEETPPDEGKDYIFRGTSQNTLDQQRGWYLDLNKADGERVVSQASISSGGTGQRVRFNTLIVTEPESICEAPARSGFIFELDLLNGSSLNDSMFMLDDIDLTELLTSGTPAAVSHNQGQGSTTVLETGQDTEVLVTGDGELMTVTSDPLSTGRRSWEQLR